MSRSRAQDTGRPVLEPARAAAGDRRARMTEEPRGVPRLRTETPVDQRPRLADAAGQRACWWQPID